MAKLQGVHEVLSFRSQCTSSLNAQSTSWPAMLMQLVESHLVQSVAEFLALVFHSISC